MLNTNIFAYVQYNILSSGLQVSVYMLEGMTTPIKPVTGKLWEENKNGRRGLGT
jgi:hypothetical protein